MKKLRAHTEPNFDKDEVVAQGIVIFDGIAQRDKPTKAKESSVIGTCYKDQRYQFAEILDKGNIVFGRVFKQSVWIVIKEGSLNYVQLEEQISITY